MTKKICSCKSNLHCRIEG